MKFEARVACMLLLLLSLGGCSFLQNSVDNVLAAPSDAITNYWFMCKLHRLARSAWEEIQKLEGIPHCPAYAQGFEEGFVDYVSRNGGGVPPAIPPYHLQRSALWNLDKQNDIEEWYAGFRHGAQAGKASGLRERVIVPISLPPEGGKDYPTPPPARESEVPSTPAPAPGPGKSTSPPPISKPAPGPEKSTLIPSPARGPEKSTSLPMIPPAPTPEQLTLLSRPQPTPAPRRSTPLPMLQEQPLTSASTNSDEIPWRSSSRKLPTDP